VDPARARTLTVVLIVAATLGALARLPADGALPAPCALPARAGDVVVCDGAGVDIGGRAWLFGRKLDVNRATVADLERVPGVGRTLATRIVAERDRRGRFARLAELDEVDGVGPKLLARLGALADVR